MYIHKGKLIEKAVRHKEFSISLLARRLGKSRRHVYNIFEKPDVSLDVILQIGTIIHYDFTDEIKELSQIPEDFKYSVLHEPNPVKDSVAYWRGKYLELLEKHQALLDGKLDDYLKKEQENKK